MCTPKSSLAPRLFPPPVFDRILYAKTEGEGLGERVTCVKSGRREGRHKGGRCLMKNLEVLLVMICNSRINFLTLCNELLVFYLQEVYYEEGPPPEDWNDLNVRFIYYC